MLLFRVLFFRCCEQGAPKGKQMQCSCGAETKDHDVVRNGVVAAKYARCVSCGRILWIKPPIERVPDTGLLLESSG